MRLLVFLACAFAAAAAAAQAQFPVVVVATATVASAPERGFSAVNLRFDGTYWVLGVTGRALHHVYIDWQRGSGRILDTEKLPEATHARAMQVLGDSIWLADDRGPSLVEADWHGRLLGQYAVRGAFGGLAASRDGRFLYAAFAQAMSNGAPYARLLEFEVAKRRWTGRSLRYPLEAAGNEITDLRFVDARTALVVERGAALRRIYRALVAGDELVKAAFVDLSTLKLAAVDGIEIVEPGYIVLSSAERRELVLLRSPDLLFPAFERSRP